MSQYVYPSRAFQLLLKCLLVFALLSLRRFDLDPDVLAVYHANDVWRARRAEAVEMAVLALERAGIVPVVEDVPECEIVEDLLLYFRFFHSFCSKICASDSSGYNT